MRSSRSLIDWSHRGLSLPAEPQDFLHGLPASLCLIDIELMSYGQVEEWICGLSITSVAGRHPPGRAAHVWLGVIDSLEFILFTECLCSVSLSEPVGRCMPPRSGSVSSLEVTPAMWICEKEKAVPAPPAGADLAPDLPTLVPQPADLEL